MSALDTVFAALQSMGCSPRKTKDGYQAKCPAHEDSTPSLSVTQTDGKVLLHCHAGCTPQDVTHALGLGMADLFDDTGGRVAPSPSQRNTATGLTLEQYAQAKRLPLDFLKRLGVSEISYFNDQAVRIPYIDENGDLKATRFRTALDGPERFKWKKGSKPMLYGLNRLKDACAERFVVLVEGESDAQTLWFHGIPALGIPGSSSWKDEWADHLNDVETVYVVREPDGAGKAMVEKIGQGQLRAKLRILDLAPWKDPSEMHIAGEAEFVERLSKSRSESTSLDETQIEEAKRAGEEAWKMCKDIAENNDILQEFAYEIGHNVSGDLDNAKILFLVMVSRLFGKPCSAVVKGESGSGKSYLVQQVLQFFPPSAYLSLTGMSPKALLYLDESLKHRMLIVAEVQHDASEFHDYALRSILSEGRLVYKTVESTSRGNQTRALECEGPTGLITTTTASSIHPENETRLISLKVSYTPESGRESMLRTAEIVNRHNEPDRSSWQALQVWLESGDRRVVVPYAKSLSRLFPAALPRAHRDFMQVLTLVKAHALLHRQHRDRDGDGCIVATTEDYAVVAGLIDGPLSQTYASNVSRSVRDTVLSVQALLADGHDPVTQADLAKRWNIDPSNVSRRVSKAIELGYVRNTETRAGHAQRLVLGDPLPDKSVLPSADEVLRACALAKGDPLPPPPSSEPTDRGDGFFMS